MDDTKDPAPNKSQDAADDATSAEPSIPASPDADDAITDTEIADALQTEAPEPAADLSTDVVQSATTDDESIASLTNLMGKDAAPVSDPVPLDRKVIDKLLTVANENTAAAIEAAPPSVPAEPAADAREHTAFEDTQPVHTSELPPVPDTATTGDLVDAEDLEKLLNGAESEQVLDQRGLDSVLSATAQQQEMDTLIVQHADDEQVTLQEEDIDALIAGAVAIQPPEQDMVDLIPPDSADADVLNSVADPEAEMDDAPAMELPQDMLDQILKEAAGHEIADAGDDIPVSEELHAPPDASKPAHSAKNAEELIPAQAAITQATPEKSKPAPSKAQSTPRENAPTKPKTPRKWLKPVSSIAAGLLVTGGTFAALMSNQERLPEKPSHVESLHPVDLAAAIGEAQTMMGEHHYEEAAAVLREAIPHAQTHPQLADAEFMQLEATYRQLMADGGVMGAEDLHKEIEHFVLSVPNYHRNAEALRWRAELYQKAGNPGAAREMYARALSGFPRAPDMDETLLGASKLALEMKQPVEAAEHAQKILDQFGHTQAAPEAMLVMGDALVAEGHVPEGRALYQKVATEQAHSKFGAEATVRLSKLDLEDGKPEEAIKTLEARLQAATSVEGNDEIYLLLAKAYGMADKPDRAEETLRELLNFFPDSASTPEAMIALSQSLSAMGREREALRVANQASQRYPEHLDTYRNEAEMLEADGEERAAAEVWQHALDTGAKDPALLLSAARAYTKIDDHAKARAIYDQLVTVAPSSPQALDANIELATAMFKQGQAKAALTRLQTLTLSARGKAQYPRALSALADMYTELGFRQAAADTYSDLAPITSDPEILGKAAMAFFDARETSMGLSAAARVNLDGVADHIGYGVLTRQGKALLPSNKGAALEKLAQAYKKYPDQRRPEGDLYLLDAYISTNDMESARSVLMELAAINTASPGSVAYLPQAAIAVGDAYFKRADYPAAEEVYALIEAPEGQETDATEWAAYQLGNTLLKQARYSDSLPLFTKVAGGGSAWADEARIKQNYAALETRLLETKLLPMRAWNEPAPLMPPDDLDTPIPAGG